MTRAGGGGRGDAFQPVFLVSPHSSPAGCIHCPLPLPRHNTPWTPRFYEVQKYLIHTTHIVRTGSIIFNEALFQAQPKEFQRALIDSAQEAADWYLQFLTSDEGKMLEQLKGYGMTVVEPHFRAFRETTAKIYDKYDQIWTKALREKIQNYKI